MTIMGRTDVVVRAVPVASYFWSGVLSDPQVSGSVLQQCREYRRSAGGKKESALFDDPSGIESRARVGQALILCVVSLRPCSASQTRFKVQGDGNVGGRFHETHAEKTGLLLPRHRFGGDRARGGAGDQDISKGEDLLKNKQYKEARALLEAGIQKDPLNVQAHLSLAEACRSLIASAKGGDPVSGREIYVNTCIRYHGIDGKERWE